MKSLTFKRYGKYESNVLDIINDKNIQKICPELSILNWIDHPNIIKMHEYFITESKSSFQKFKIRIILDYSEFGSINNFIEKNKNITF